MGKTMTSNFEQVKEFMRAFGQDVHEDARVPALAVTELRKKLIDEEATEVYQELHDMHNLDNRPLQDRIHALAKELTDLLVVTYGCGAAYGIDLDKCMKEVHSSNMSKLGDDGKPIYRKDGKILKGPNYKEANMKDALR